MAASENKDVGFFSGHPVHGVQYCASTDACIRLLLNILQLPPETYDFSQRKCTRLYRVRQKFDF